MNLFLWVVLYKGWVWVLGIAILKEKFGGLKWRQSSYKILKHSDCTDNWYFLLILFVWLSLFSLCILAYIWRCTSCELNIDASMCIISKDIDHLMSDIYWKNINMMQQTTCANKYGKWNSMLWTRWLIFRYLINLTHLLFQ